MFNTFKEPSVSLSCLVSIGTLVVCIQAMNFTQAIASERFQVRFNVQPKFQNVWTRNVRQSEMSGLTGPVNDKKYNPWHQYGGPEH